MVQQPGLSLWDGSEAAVAGSQVRMLPQLGLSSVGSQQSFPRASLGGPKYGCGWRKVKGTRP